MDDAMVTGRMSTEKKAAGNAVLEEEGLNASAAINLLYERLAQEHSAEFLVEREATPQDWETAAKFIDSLTSADSIETSFDSMSRGQIKLSRARARGVI